MYELILSSLNIFYSRALFSRLSLFNFQGPFAPRSRGQLCYYITPTLACQVLFLFFLKNFLGLLLRCGRSLERLNILPQQPYICQEFFSFFCRFVKMAQNAASTNVHYLSKNVISSPIMPITLGIIFTLSVSFPIVSPFMHLLLYKFQAVFY